MSSAAPRPSGEGLSLVGIPPITGEHHATRFPTRRHVRPRSAGRRAARAVRVSHQARRASRVVPFSMMLRCRENMLHRNAAFNFKGVMLQRHLTTDKLKRLFSLSSFRTSTGKSVSRNVFFWRCLSPVVTFLSLPEQHSSTYLTSYYINTINSLRVSLI